PIIVKQPIHALKKDKNNTSQHLVQKQLVNKVGGNGVGEVTKDLISSNIDQQTQDMFPMNSQDALKKYDDQLTEYEKSEIHAYKNIYFIGKNEIKKIDCKDSLNNFGFDDERGDYRIVLNDHFAYRFEVFELLGKGSFGQVVKAFDHKHKMFVAVKTIRNKKRFHQQALVEVKILQTLREKDIQDQANVIHMNGHFYFRNHLCISFELLSINLYEFIKLNNFYGVSVSLVLQANFTSLDTSATKPNNTFGHLSSIQPENLLLKSKTKSAIKVIDFGSSCFDDQKIYTYIQSRFYRSPEIILGIPYTMGIDMWSLGCILAELHSGHPIFPGENEHEQLICIMEIFGVPPANILELSKRKKLFFGIEILIMSKMHRMSL
ncbi:Protein kinase, catalytic domain-containing protein, partial [Rozella allomycis CSF55]